MMVCSEDQNDIWQMAGCVIDGATHLTVTMDATQTLHALCGAQGPLRDSYGNAERCSECERIWAEIDPREVTP